MSFKGKLRTAITVGSLIPVVVFVIFTFLTVSTMKSIENDFHHYRKLARGTSLSGILESHMLMVQIYVKNFIISGNPNEVEQYHVYRQKMRDLLKEEGEMIEKPERVSKIQFIANSIGEYESSFEQVIKLRERRNHMVNVILNPNGLAARKNMTQLIESAYADKDLVAAHYGGRVQEHLLLARLHVIKFLENHLQENLDRVYLELEKVRETQAILKKELQNPVRQQLLQSSIESLAKYKTTFTQLAELISQQDKIATEHLDRIGPSITKASNDITFSIKKDQDLLGPKVEQETEAFLQKTKILSLSCVIIAIVITILITFYITRLVMKPLGGEPGEMANLVMKVSEGDLKQDITDLDGKTGLLHYLLKMVEKLVKFFSELGKQSSVLASSSQELSAISSQLSENALNATQQASIVAASADQITSNIQSMASGATQLSNNIGSVSAAAVEVDSSMAEVNHNVQNLLTRINEVSEKATEAGAVIHQAENRSEEVKTVMTDLSNSANEIGDVTEIIKALAQQTNLLALNANIEAASAGEAGRGFAVVANEIKTLANQSASAADSISHKVTNVQNISNQTIRSIESITDIINRIVVSNESILKTAQSQLQLAQSSGKSLEQANMATNDVARLMQEMSAATKELAGNINELALGVAEISQNIAKVSEASNENANSAKQVYSEAAYLANFAESIRKNLSFFKISEP